MPPHLEHIPLGAGGIIIFRQDLEATGLLHGGLAGCDLEFFDERAVLLSVPVHLRRDAKEQSRDTTI